jgi:integrase
MLKSADQLLTGQKPARSDIRYWQGTVFQRIRKRNGVKERAKHFSVQLRFGGRRQEFNLGTANRAVAAQKARTIYEYLRVNGWEQTLLKFKTQSAPPSVDNEIRTVGELIAAIEATTTKANRTMAEYARRFRTIVADILELDGQRAKYDYVGKGREQWLAKIHSLELRALTPARIQAWRIGYLNKAGKSPAAQRAAKISVNSTLRQARSLFSPRRLAYVQLPLDFVSPFTGIRLEPRQSSRYRSPFDVQKLIAAARNDLAENDREAYKVFLLALLCGLRRGEIDRLEWSAFDWDKTKLHVEVTQHLEVKSQDCIGDIDLDPELIQLFKNFHDQSTSAFVVESDRSVKIEATYFNYRCGKIFKRLNRWLRKHGVRSSRAVHALRKEFGSQVCERHGLYAASRALRHADVAITSQHYLDKRSRVTTGLGALLAPNDSF